MVIPHDTPQCVARSHLTLLPEITLEMLTRNGQESHLFERQKENISPSIWPMIFFPRASSFCLDSFKQVFSISQGPCTGDKSHLHSAWLQLVTPATACASKYNPGQEQHVRDAQWNIKLCTERGTELKGKSQLLLSAFYHTCFYMVVVSDTCAISFSVV